MAHYTKPPLTFIDQTQLLLDRGLVASREELEIFLRRVNYYRLTGYLYPFKKVGEENFIEGTNLFAIKERYNLDKKLRLLVLDGIERIEVGVLRSQLVEYFAVKYGAFGFIRPQNFKDKNLYPQEFHSELVNFSSQLLVEAKDDFVLRYRKKYTSEQHLPIWMLVEKMTFGYLSIFLGNLRREDRLALAQRFDLPYKVFVSWIHSLSFIRNLCAHHDRLWNRHIQIQPQIPNIKTNNMFYYPVEVSPAGIRPRIFPILVVIQYLLNYMDGTNDWGDRLIALVSDYRHLPIRKIGFPDKWEQLPFWS